MLQFWGEDTLDVYFRFSYVLTVKVLGYPSQLGSSLPIERFSYLYSNIPKTPIDRIVLLYITYLPLCPYTPTLTVSFLQ